MPMGTAARLPIDATDLIPPIKGAAPAGAPPPPAAAGMMAGPGGTPIGAFPDPTAPATPPYEVVMQPDGSSIYQTKTTPPVVIAVNPAPKIPISMQPAKP